MKHKTRKQVLDEFPEYKPHQASRLEIALVSFTMILFAFIAFIGAQL